MKLPICCFANNYGIKLNVIQAFSVEPRVSGRCLCNQTSVILVLRISY